MGRKRLNSVSKTYHIRLTEKTEREMYQFVEAQMQQGKSFKEVFNLLFNFYQANSVMEAGVVSGTGGMDIDVLTERVLRKLRERRSGQLEERFDSNFRRVSRVDVSNGS